ncbi:hypothetical protein BJX65DRAFT_277139 [Aspergillus insuetus]
MTSFRGKIILPLFSEYFSSNSITRIASIHEIINHLQGGKCSRPKKHTLNTLLTRSHHEHVTSSYILCRPVIEAPSPARSGLCSLISGSGIELLRTVFAFFIQNGEQSLNTEAQYQFATEFTIKSSEVTFDFCSTALAILLRRNSRRSSDAEPEN